MTPPRALMIDEIVSLIMWEGFLSITSTALRPGSVKERPRDPTSYLLAMTAVSRAWRGIAIEQSRLWSVFYLGWPPGQREAWLRRARDKLLDVCVGETLIPEESFEVFVRINHRCRSLSLPRDLNRTNRTFEQLDDHAEFPLLDTILIRWMHDGGRNPWQTHWGAARTDQHARRYPSLRTLELGRVCSHNRSLLVLPPSVARLELSSCGLHQNETLAEVCTRLGTLETLMLSGYDCSFWSIPSPPPITFDVPVALRLHTLVLGPGLGTGAMNFFADSYHYPLLRTLYIVSATTDHLGNLVRQSHEVLLSSYWNSSSHSPADPRCIGYNAGPRRSHQFPEARTDDGNRSEPKSSADSQTLHQHLRQCR